MPGTTLLFQKTFLPVTPVAESEIRAKIERRQHLVKRRFQVVLRTLCFELVSLASQVSCQSLKRSTKYEVQSTKSSPLRLCTKLERAPKQFRTPTRRGSDRVVSGKCTISETHPVATAPGSVISN